MSTAFEIIWDEFSIPLRSYIKRRVSKEQDAEDIIQTVFLKLLANLKDLKDTNKLRAWVYTITRNTIHDYYKSQRQVLNIDDYSEEIQIEDDIDGTVDDEIAQCLKIMVQNLPEKYKEAVLLTEFQNLTQSELALQLGLSLPGAKSRVQRARKYLKDMLLSCCDFEMDHRGNIIDYKRKSEVYNSCCK
ncbi:MAG TPA: RNA polymerase sigma factor SigZ [Mobilitalea sp.]|nr:RNA polymerase sigma factor SigZ [Mobilitalea sp.]